MQSVKKSALDLIGEKVYSANTQKKHGGLYSTLKESIVVDVVYSATDDEYTISYDNSKEDFYSEVPMLETSKEYCQYKVDEYNKKNIQNTIDKLDKEINELQSKIDKLLFEQQKFRINRLANKKKLDMLNAGWSYELSFF